MFPIRAPKDADRIGDPALRSLVRRRLSELTDGEPYDRGVHGEVIVVEPGDTAATPEEQSGCASLHNGKPGSRGWRLGRLQG